MSDERRPPTPSVDDLARELRKAAERLDGLFGLKVLVKPETIKALLDDRDELLLAVRRIHASQQWVPLGVDLGRWWSPGDPYPPETPEERQARKDWA